ncbi:hypothetical protein HK104_001366 [Borealophlyctis nickersoniae]|nr:hypothetical protein HK104_001366 [Borealophlyctis nickersoniae]
MWPKPRVLASYPIGKLAEYHQKLYEAAVSELKESTSKKPLHLPTRLKLSRFEKSLGVDDEVLEALC